MNLPNPNPSCHPTRLRHACSGDNFVVVSLDSGLDSNLVDSLADCLYQKTGQNNFGYTVEVAVVGKTDWHSWHNLMAAGMSGHTVDCIGLAVVVVFASTAVAEYCLKNNLDTYSADSQKPEPGEAAATGPGRSAAARRAAARPRPASSTTCRALPPLT